MFGITIDGPAYVFCDNQYVTNNVVLPHSILNKSHNAIYYYRLCKAQAAYVIRLIWIQGEYNQSDLGTNTTLSAKRRYKLVNDVMWNVGFAILN